MSGGLLEKAKQASGDDDVDVDAAADAVSPARSGYQGNFSTQVVHFPSQSHQALKANAV